MNENTINTEVTMSGATGTLIAGRYRVVRQLGQGGMGSVWLAEDNKLDSFKVAIKMLPSVLVNNKRAYQQVKAEALVSLKLSHPNIATVRAFEEESGNPFLVMDYIDGQTLDDYLAEKGKLSEEETVELLKPVAAALDYAHTQGVVHRDVKPGNVMIRKDGTPFVLDFGIAREIQETMTRVTGKLSSGTLLYMSPEQLNGDAPKPAQDVYSFAAMAYECLKGEPPFSRGQVEFQILNKEPEPLPGGSDLARSILRGLAKAPVARPEKCIGVVAPVVVSRPHPKPIFERVSVPKEDVRFIPPEERSRFAKEADAGDGSSRSTTSDNGAPAQGRTTNASRPWIGLVGAVCLGFYLGGSLLGGPLGALLGAFGTYLIFKFTAKRGSFPLGLWNYGALVLPLVLFAFLWGSYKSEEADPIEARSPAPIVQTESGDVEKSRADALRAMALSQIEICRRFDKGDGFKAKIEACENVLSRARTEYELKEWKKSASSYDEVVDLCKQLMSLNESRNLARKAAAEMEKQARVAKEAEADKYAKGRFDAAKKQVEQARQEFAAMRFEGAMAGHAAAERLFEKSVSEARENKTRLEKEEEERKRREAQVTPMPTQRNAGSSSLLRTKKSDLDDLLADLEGKKPSRQPNPARTYAYTAELVPYVVENGVKRNVAVSVSCGDANLNARVVNDGGLTVVLIGSDVRPTGAVAVNLSTSSRSRRTWLSASDFSTNGHPMKIEVVLK